MRRSKKYIDAVMEGVRIQSADLMFMGDMSITMSIGEVSMQVEIVMSRGTSLSYASAVITPSIPKEIWDSINILRLMQIVHDLKAKELVGYVTRYIKRGEPERRRIQKMFRDSENEMGV